MALIRLENITKSYGATLVLEDITWQLNIGEKVGLVGTNGTGKTTLMKIINGKIDYDSGRVQKMNNLRIGYLPQEVHLESDSTIHAEMLLAFEEVNRIKTQMRELEHQMTEADANLEELTKRYGELQHKFEHRDGYNIETKIDKVLYGLGFTKDDWKLPVNVLSGGQQSRVALAKLLLQKPDIILLDEPTNHLDINGVEWLEQFLIDYESAILVVSHDRYFLDKVVGKIIELEFNRLNEYSGNYSKYVRLKTEQLAQRQKLYELQRAEIEHQEDFIRKNMAGQRTKSAQSRLKKLEKMDKITPPKHQKKINLNFDPKRRGGNDVLHVTDLTKRYDDLTLFEDLNFYLERGQRLGIVGPNGCGKTTLLKIVIGEEEPTEGDVKIGHGIDIGYYDQKLDTLNPENTVLEEVWEIQPMASVGDMRSFLGKFLFSGEDVFLPIKKLSGGEQSRVALAKLILSGVNFLILDEPTNHLDIYSRMALEEALEGYEGTILTVSHDRYFLDKIANRTIYMENGDVKLYLGNYSYLEKKRKAEREKEMEKERVIRAKKKAKRKREKQKHRKKRKKLRPIKVVEEEIAYTEMKIEEIGEEMNNPEIYTEHEVVNQLNTELNALNETLETLYEEWEEIMESIEAKEK